ncbi:MAG: BrnA antitoxin family protein [Alphaproteobacteria bacterium]|nr:BrnA antitoxin family protein [Alphaproteobacteria bacterium]MDE2493571.1 BrnA antitoxin family protein [Alphaproteobacteria bacterium]
MARRRNDRPVNDEDVPAMTAADFARAKPAAQAMPEVVMAMKRARGRPRLDRPKEHVTLRLDAKVVDAFKADGPGWQARINVALLRLVVRRETAKKNTARSRHRAA